MCQVDEEYNGHLEKSSTLTPSKKCVKCKEGTAALLIRAGDAFCRACFKEYFVHKFRAMLGKNRVIFPGERVLLAVSGGPTSSSMLAQVQEGLNGDAPKKLRFVPGIVFIDEGGACGHSMEERKRVISQLELIFKATGFPYHIVHLEQVSTLPGSVLEAVPAAVGQPARSYKAAVDHFLQRGGGHSKGEEPGMLDAESGLAEMRVQTQQPCPPEHSRALHDLFSSLNTLTAKEEMLQTLRKHLILHTARVHGYSKVMMGESASRVAVRLLSCISLGRGASLASDTGFSDPRYGDVVVVRPMRDYSSKEICFYNRLFGVPSVFIPGLDTKASDKASIQRLTESFVSKLQADFPSTVSTIYRTSEKLHTSCSSQGSADSAAKCLLCLCAMDTDVEEASAFQATQLSERLSRRRDQGSDPQAPPVGAGSQCCTPGEDGQGCGTGGGCCSSSVQSHSTPDLKSFLCYSCRLTIKDMTGVECLPQYIRNEAERRQRRSQMRTAISEFLLEDEEDEESEETVH